MSGFGRTGEWFAVNLWDVEPDMIATAKGLTSGHLPLGAVIVSEPIAAYFDEHTFWSGMTYSSHTLSCTAGIATLEAYQEDGLFENARKMGQVMASGLADLKARHPAVGDVRGVGLFWVVELVKDRQTREPLVPWDPDIFAQGPMVDIVRYMREHGVYIFSKWNNLYAVPPLCITADQIAEGLAVLDGALQIADASL
jgi:taurine--2-oxoglutarate transaminase